MQGSLHHPGRHGQRLDNVVVSLAGREVDPLTDSGLQCLAHWLQFPRPAALVSAPLREMCLSDMISEAPFPLLIRKYQKRDSACVVEWS